MDEQQQWHEGPQLLAAAASSSSLQPRGECTIRMQANGQQYLQRGPVAAAAPLLRPQKGRESSSLETVVGFMEAAVGWQLGVAACALRQQSGGDAGERAALRVVVMVMGCDGQQGV